MRWQGRRGGDRLDGAPVLVQQAPGLCEGSPDRGPAGAEQAGEGVLGQGQAQVEHGGHDAVGEGEGERPAGAGLVPGVAGGMVARPLLALGLPQGGEPCDQLIQLGVGRFFERRNSRLNSFD